MEASPFMNDIVSIHIFRRLQKKKMNANSIMKLSLVFDYSMQSIVCSRSILILNTYLVITIHMDMHQISEVHRYHCKIINVVDFFYLTWRLSKTSKCVHHTIRYDFEQYFFKKR